MALKPPPSQKSTGFKKRHGAVALGALAPDMLALVLQQRGFATTALLTEWAEIVGPAIAPFTSPLEIRWPKRRKDGPASFRDEKTQRATLIVACSSAFALDLGMASPRIIEAVNRRLGYGAVGTMEIRHAPPAAKKPAAKRPQENAALVEKFHAGFGGIEDEGLRRALARFGAAVQEKAVKNAL